MPARVPNGSPSRVLGWLLLALLSGCGQGEDLAGTRLAVLRITTTTNGTGSDADGYAVVIDGGGPEPIGQADTLVESALTPGEHNTELTAVSRVCAVDSGAYRTFIVQEGDTSNVDYAVSCSEAPTAASGSVEVTLTTVGVNQDTDGYVIALDPADSRSVGLNETVRFDEVEVGTTLVRLSALAAQCSVQGENPQTVEVAPQAVVAVNFTVRCWPAPTGTIALSHAFSSEEISQIHLVSPDGQLVEDFFDADFVDWPSWSPTGDFLAFTAPTGALGDETVFVREAEGFDDPIELTGCGPTGFRPQWSPDGTRMLCLSAPGVPSGVLSSVRRDGRDVRTLSPAGLRVASASFLPDGGVIFAVDDFEAGRSIYRVGARGGPPDPLFDLPEDVFGADRLIALSPDGTRLTFVRFPLGNRLELYTVALNGTSPTRVSSLLDVQSFSPPTWSPDGSRLAFIATPIGGPDGVWLVAPDSSGLTRLPIEATSFSSVSWSPDGNYLVVDVPEFDANGRFSGPSKVYTIRADGSGAQEITDGRSFDVHPAWGP